MPGNRKSIRLPDYDYSQAGPYFVTICVDDRKPILGRVHDLKFWPSPIGEIAEEGLEWLAKQFDLVSVQVLCVMPNHVHAILLLADAVRGGLQTARTQSGVPKPKPLGRIIGAYKTHTTSQINKIQNTSGQRFWQRNYYERVIRNETEYEATLNYIVANPLNWESDKEYVDS